MKTENLLVLFLFIISSVICNAQHIESKKFHSYHSLGLFISHTQKIESVNENSDQEWLSFPSWELNYNFKFSPEWSIGLHNDVTIETKEVEHENESESTDESESESSNTEIERSYPFASAVVFSFKPVKYFSFLLGAGGEFVSSDSYFLIKTGVEYGYEINENFELNANATYDIKINTVNSMSVALGVTKIF